MVYVSRDKLNEIKKAAQARAEKRQEKRALLPWASSSNSRRKRSPSLFKTLSARLDKLWADAVRSRDRARYGDVCRIRRAKNCTNRNECAYHLISKARGHTIRWNLDAGVASCKPCNFGEMMNRALYAEYHDEIFGREFMDSLRGLARNKIKLSQDRMKDLCLEIQSMYYEGVGSERSWIK